MALLQSPFTFLPAYRPISYVASVDSATGTVLENAVVVIKKDGIAIGPAIRFKSIENFPSVPGFDTYVFNIDIQKYCQDTLGPTEELPTTFYNTPNVACSANAELADNYTIEVDYEQINPTTGLLEASAIPTDTSTGIDVYSIARQHQEDMDLTPYVVGPVDFLTSSSRTVDVCFEDNVFLSSAIGSQFNAFEVLLYDANGALLYAGYTDCVNLTVIMTTINVGLNHLSTILTWYDAVPNFFDPLISSYSITMGVLLSTGPVVYGADTETFNYNIVGKCCGKRDLRLHWMNFLSGTDSYTFNSEKDLILKTTSDRAQKALNWVTGSATPHDVSDVGNFKIKSEGQQTYRLKSRFLTNEKALWLGQLLTSPKVYAEIDGEFIPVIVEDTEQSISRQNGFIQYEIQVTLANDLIIQRV